MSDAPFTREQFLEALNGIAGGRTTAQQLTRNLRRALLDFGSEAPDNLNCAGQVEVGPVGSEIGPKITGRDVLFSDIAHALDSEPLPEGHCHVYSCAARKCTASPCFTPQQSWHPTCP